MRKTIPFAFILVTVIGATLSVPAAAETVTKVEAQKACGGHMEDTAYGTRSCLTNKGATAYYCGGKNKSPEDCVKIDLPKKTSGKSHPQPAPVGNAMRSNKSQSTVSATGTAKTPGVDTHHSRY